MKKITFSLIILLTMILSGCSDKITSGEVVKKEFTPAHVETVMIPVFKSNGKTTSTNLVPYIYYYNDKWEISIEQCSNGKSLNATYRVTEDVFNKIKIGDYFEYDKDFEPLVSEYTREIKK